MAKSNRRELRDSDPRTNEIARERELALLRREEERKRGIAWFVVIVVAVGVAAAYAMVSDSLRNPAMAPARSSDTGGDPRGSPTPTSAAASSTIGVPPLLPGEKVPMDQPNYFEPREQDSGGVMASLASCEESARKSGPNIPAEQIARYCRCVTDAMRTNFRVTHDSAQSVATWEQLRTCGATTKSGAGSPYATAFPRSTENIVALSLDCLKKNGAKDHGVFCGCYVDALIKNTRPLVSPEDARGCETADRYFDATKTHLTPRQFAALERGQ